MIVAGIDPGKTGGIVVISSERRSAVGPLWSYEVVSSLRAARYYDGSDIDLIKLRSYLSDLKGLSDAAGERLVIGLEKAELRPGEGIKSVASNWGGYYALHGVAVGLGIPVQVRTSKGWQSALAAERASTMMSARVLNLQFKTLKPTKAASVAVAERYLTNLDLTPGRIRRPLDGLSDAGGIAIASLKRINSRR